MAEVLKNLGQEFPAAAVLTNLYTVPTGKSAVVSTLVVCNHSSNIARFRISHSVAGASDEEKQYLYRDEMVFRNKTFTITLGITLAAGDIIRCYSDNGQLSFGLYGSEIT